jgi:hypothetical protein
MGTIYVYAIISAHDAVDFNVAGIDWGDSEVRVYVITHRDLAAVVSDSPILDHQALKRADAVSYLVVHERVIEAVMRTTPVLPVKFGTVLPDEDRVHHLLEQGEGLFRSALEKFDDQVQMEVVLLWNLNEIFEQIGQEEAIFQLKTCLATNPPEDMMTGRIVLGQMVHASLEKHRAILRDRLLLGLQGITLDWVTNVPMDDSMAVNVALLVHKTNCEELDRCLDYLDKEFEGRFHLRCIGPLPPYSFATVEVQVPSFEAIDQARSLLDLEEITTMDEIKWTFQRIAKQVHPDHNLTDPEAESHMAELTQAYRLLMNYAETRIAAWAAEPVGNTAAESYNGTAYPASLSRQTVEQTLLIALRRQETLELK